MKKISKKLSESNGNVGLTSIIILIVFMLIMVIVTQMIKPFMVMETVQGAVQQASNDVAAQNSYALYNGVRESNNAATEFNGAGWSTASLNNAVIGRLKQLLKLNFTSGQYEQTGKDGLVAYSISDVSISCSAIPAQGAGHYKITTSLVLHIPLRVGERTPIVTVKIPMKIKTKYTPMF